MKNFHLLVIQTTFLVTILFSVLSVGRDLRSTPIHDLSFDRAGDYKGGQSYAIPKGEGKEKVGTEVKELYPAGSTLPDCTHACGPCSPCKRVMVSFKCTTSESCPVVYRCMCKGKYYQVPSS